MLVGLTGKIKSGKSELAKVLINDGYLLYNFKQGLIDEIKTNFYELLDIISKKTNKTVDELFTIKPYEPEIRALLRNYGTDVRRKDNPDYWVNKWYTNLPKNKDIVVDDVRFLNEANIIKKQGGIIIRINRTGIDINDNHQSEKEMDLIEEDYLIYNNATIEDLKNKIYKII